MALHRGRSRSTCRASRLIPAGLRQAAAAPRGRPFTSVMGPLMAALSSINIASSTGSNWLKEGQDATDAAADPGGMMGALQNSKDPGSLSTFLSQSQTMANNLAQINSSTASDQNTLTMQMNDAAKQKLASE